MLVLVFGWIYLLPRYTEAWELTLLILAVVLSMVWLAGCFFASQFRWRHYWWRWFWVALLQPGFASWWERRPPCLSNAPRLPRWAM